MNFKNISDQELLAKIKILAQQEREVLTQILNHLREIERRKLFSDFGYQSLFEYAVKELKYSEGQAGRRIQAMRLLKELPELEEKISVGTLNLSNISQAQSYFRQQQNDRVHKIGRFAKIELLTKLENKSAREGQKMILSLQQAQKMDEYDHSLMSLAQHRPRERVRQITVDTAEMCFSISSNLKSQLDEVRSLLGVAGASMSFAELVLKMAELSIKTLKEKKFGKKAMNSTVINSLPDKSATNLTWMNSVSTPTLEKHRAMGTLDTSQNDIKNRNWQSTRSVAQKIKLAVWTRDHGKCVNCESTRNLNYDHIKPFAYGGTSTSENLQLLCFHCNQRKAIKTFGTEKMGRSSAAIQFK